MNLRGFIYSFFVVVALMAMSSCSKIPKSVKMLNDDAAILVRIDVKQLAEKAGLSKEKGAVEGWLSKLSPEAQKKIKEILDKPVKLGLDLRDPLFFSANEKGDYRLVGTVYDDDNFRDFLNAVSKDAGFEKVKEKDGLQMVDIKGTLLAFDGDCFLITKSDADVKAIFKSDSKLTDDEDFVKMCDRESDIQMLIKGEPLSRKNHLDGELADMMEDMSYLTDVVFDKGELVATTENLFKSDKAKKIYDKYTALMGDIKGDFANYFSKNGMAFFGNIKGEKLYELLDKMGYLDMAKKFGGMPESELADMLKSINGDVAFGLNSFNNPARGNAGGSGSLYVSMASDKLLRLLSGALRWKEVTPGTYQLNMGGMDVILGYKNGAMFALGSSEKNDSVSVEPFANVPNALTKSDILAKGKGLYFFMNMRMFDVSSDAKEILKDLDKFEMYTDKDRKFILRLSMTDKERNAVVPFTKFLYRYFSMVKTRSDEIKATYSAIQEADLDEEAAKERELRALEEMMD